MSAEILPYKPLPGKFQEKHYGSVFNSQFRVKFTDNNFKEWVGCFPKPYLALDKVLTNSTNETAFVVAGGQGYFIDISNRELIQEIENIPILESLIHTNSPEYFLVSACYCIYIFDSKKLIQRYKPDFTVDGIYFTGQKGQKVFGHINSCENPLDLNIGFEFDLKTKEISIKSDR
jgi:hypothetical protein